MSFCGTESVTGETFHNGQPMVGYARLKCRCWDCPDCGPRRARRLARDIAATAVMLDLTRFLTLTIDPERVPDKVCPEFYIKAVWAKFRTYLRRRFGSAVKYILVVEPHRSGVPHLHILVDRFLPQRWVSRCWSKLGGGRVVWIEKVRSERKTAGYVAKYLSKGLTVPWARGARRYTVSRGIQLLRPVKQALGQLLLPWATDTAPAWSLLTEAIETLYARYGIRATIQRFDRDGSILMFAVPA